MSIGIYKDEKGEANIPEAYRSDVTYGDMLRGIAVYLYSEGVVAFDRIRNFLSGLTGNKAMLCKANEQRKKHISEGTPFSEDELNAFEEEFRTILAEGHKENESCKPKWAKKDENTLLNRLEKYRENHPLFLYDFDVPFDNNLSERDLRKCKNRQKMSGGFRTEEGVDMFSIILSVVETCKRPARPILDSIIRLFQNTLVLFEGE